MSHVPHELAEDFPEHAETITALKAGNPHFAKLSDEYHDVNRTIHRGETNIEPMDDFRIETLRKQRMALKDELYAIIKAG